MSVISPSNNMEFRDASIVISNVKRFLKSFNAFDLLNESEFYRYISEILNQLGLGAFKESEAFIEIDSSKGLLPDNFRTLYAAYKTTPFFTHAPTSHLQGSSYSLTTKITHKVISELNRCTVDCCENNTGVIESLEVKNYVNDGGFINFRTPILLTLSPNVKRDFIDPSCQNLNSGSGFEITIDDKYIYTNFDNDVIYMKYYGFPKDKYTGLPMIPNDNAIEKAIEWHIIAQSLLGMWYNGDVPDIQAKVRDAEDKAKSYLDQALHERKLPTFESMANKVKFNKGNLSKYQL